MTATGTYPIQVAATGTVVLCNWTFAAVTVPAGTFVAAGEQAFATQAEVVVVPAGQLTADGRIGAGEQAVAVVAAATGPAANVAAGAINMVVNEGIERRGCAASRDNRERLVVNPEATAGGVDDTGTEITQQDVDAATASLVGALDVAVADALGATGDAVYADPAEPPEPVIEGLDGLVGTRDQASAEISGTLAYDRLSVDAPRSSHWPANGCSATPPSCHPGTSSCRRRPRSTIGEARRDGDALIVAVTVTGASTPAIDPDEVIDASGDCPSMRRRRPWPSSAPRPWSSGPAGSARCPRSTGASRSGSPARMSRRRCRRPARPPRLEHAHRPRSRQPAHRRCGGRYRDRDGLRSGRHRPPQPRGRP